ncbi:alpha/beta fold hydrolase [Sphingomonas sp. MMS24-J13]|uniref:alpha/beta fold hydrolase n=1 Tax=Sphingomonas sp. MMS24-J13 TaxID=3238686 RepID=UPI00384A8CD7
MALADPSIVFPSVWADLRQVSFTQGFLDASGIRTRFLSSGDPSKPLLLLLHGIGGHAEAYVRNLGPHADLFWTVAIDLIGHGWTDKPAINYELPDYAAHVLAVIKALGRDRAHISGESIGGWIASYIAVYHPEVVDRLVLNTAAGWTAHPEVMARITKLSTEAAEDPSVERIRTRLEFLMYDKALVSDDLVETRRAIYAQPGFAETMKRTLSLQDMATRRRNMLTEADYQSIKAPTLVVWTSHDPTATPEEGRQIADMIPDARYIVMNECGHWPQYEDADRFNAEHIAFLTDK